MSHTVESQFHPRSFQQQRLRQKLMHCLSAQKRQQAFHPDREPEAIHIIELLVEAMDQARDTQKEYESHSHFPSHSPAHSPQRKNREWVLLGIVS